METCPNCGHANWRCTRKPGTCIDCGAPTSGGWMKCEEHLRLINAQGLDQQNRELHQALKKRKTAIEKRDELLRQIAREAECEPEKSEHACHRIIDLIRKLGLSESVVEKVGE